MLIGFGVYENHFLHNIKAYNNIFYSVLYNNNMDLIIMHNQCRKILHMYSIIFYHINICADVLGKDVIRWHHVEI